MDLRAYYRKVREVEASLTSAFVVVVSRETTDGGRAGVKTEVPKSIAARLIAEGRSRVATKEEADSFHSLNLRAREAFDQAAALSTMQVMIVPARDAKSKD